MVRDKRQMTVTKKTVERQNEEKWKAKRML